MKFRTSLVRRMKQAERLAQRYWDDPAYRLHKVNYSRVRKGKPPLTSVSEISTIPNARYRPRDERGRLI